MLFTTEAGAVEFKLLVVVLFIGLYGGKGIATCGC